MGRLPALLFFAAAVSTVASVRADWPNPDEKSCGLLVYEKPPVTDGGQLFGKPVVLPKTKGVMVMPAPFVASVKGVPQLAIVTQVDKKPVTSVEEFVQAVEAGGTALNISFLKPVAGPKVIGWTGKGTAKLPISTHGELARSATVVLEDKVSGKSWVRHKGEEFGPIETYFQLVDGKPTNFRVKFIRKGEGYLGATKVTVARNDKRATVTEDFFDWNRDINLGSVTESCDLAASKQIFDLLRIVQGDVTATVRFESSDKYVDVECDSSVGMRVRQMVTAFRSYGGQLPN
jgi:hypothetical protein